MQRQVLATKMDVTDACNDERTRVEEGLDRRGAKFTIFAGEVDGMKEVAACSRKTGTGDEAPGAELVAVTSVGDDEVDDVLGELGVRVHDRRKRRRAQDKHCRNTTRMLT